MRHSDRHVKRWVLRELARIGERLRTEMAGGMLEHTLIPCETARPAQGRRAASVAVERQALAVVRLRPSILDR